MGSWVHAALCLQVGVRFLPGVHRMVGFGEFLTRVGRDRSIENASLEYEKLKHTLYLVAEEAGLKVGVLYRAGTSGTGAASGSDEGSPTACLTSRTNGSLSGSQYSTGDIRGGSPPVPRESRVVIGDRKLTPQLFVTLLEGELDRVNAICRQRLKALQRVRQVLEVARRVRTESDRAQEFGIVVVQLVNIYDDIMLVLWFMYLNSIAVSKIVKKYNKHFPSHAYTVDPTRWQFLREGFERPHVAKAAVEAEYADFITDGCASAERGASALGGNRIVVNLAQGMAELMEKHKHHLYVADDPTAWAVAPTLRNNLGAQKVNKERRQSEQASRRAAPQGYQGRLGEDYIKGPVVGRGAYGVVCKAKMIQTNETVAIKTIQDVWTHPILAQRTYRELMIITQLSHPNVVPVLDLLLDDPTQTGSIHIVMPMISYTCEQLLMRGQLLPQHKKWFMLQLLSALAYLHALGVVHRDLKLSNVLIDDKPALYLSDFGLARTLSSGDSVGVRDCPDYVQTQWYRAPEVLLCSKMTSTATDMWSTGCIFAELLTGVPLFPGQDDRQQLELILSCCELPVPEACPLRAEVGDVAIEDMAGGLVLPARSLEDVLRVSWNSQMCAGGIQQTFSFPDALELLAEMLKFEPTQRASAKDLLNHTFFDDIPIAPSFIAEVKHAAQPLMGEEPVRLFLPCPELHSAKEYHRSLKDGCGNIKEKIRARGIRLTEHESAAFLQRAWRWRKRGGARPTPRRLSNWQDICRARPVRTVPPRKGNSSPTVKSRSMRASTVQEAGCFDLLHQAQCVVPHCLLQ